MSNAQVGQVYQQIIQDVIEASRVDFEEGGIDEGVLDELRQGWQKKLSQQQLATFPWDPKPDPPPAPPVTTAPPSAPDMPQAQSNPSNGATYPQQQPASAPGLSLPSLTMPSNQGPVIKTEPVVKVEPGFEGPPAVGQGARPPGGVQERVIQQLQTQYGDRAAGSIDKLKAGMGMQPQNGSHPQGQPRPGGPPMSQPQPGQYQGNQQYMQNYPPRGPTQQQRSPPQPPNGQRPNNSQMDGAADEESHIGVLVHQGHGGQNTELGRVEIDNMLHAQIAARAKAMEGGGLMLPLKRAKKTKSPGTYHRTLDADAGPSRFDGPGDDLDESEDEDAINSDLDDPEDNLDDDDEDEDGGHIMLCMYDKVQRVKNKWKCVLKDGVLSVNGKDYVFHKATGEYEW